MKILIKLLRFKSDFFVVVCDKRTKIEVIANVSDFG